MTEKPHYPDYDVMKHQDAWDEHTREIVSRRLKPSKPKFLTRAEIDQLCKIAAILIDDERPHLIHYTTTHIDQLLSKNIGESQRRIDHPPQSALVRRGLTALNATAQSDYGSKFSELGPKEQRELLQRLKQGQIPNTGPWQDLPQQALFQKLLDLVVEAYYSHPDIWSEIGHGGPAYPRGYVRVELGLIDPWEPVREE